MLHYDRLPVLDITIDGRKLDRRQMLITAVMIGPTTGGGFKMAPEADPCDGKLDVLLMRKMSRFKALMVMQLTKAGRHTGVRGVKMLRAQEINISSEHTVQARATDTSGATQPLQAAPNPAGYGNNSIHEVRFHAAA